MSKQKKNIIMVVLLLVILAITLTVFFVTREDKPEKDNKNTAVSSEVSSVIKVEDIENEETESNTDNSKLNNSSFIEPDETEADKLLEENKTTASFNTSSETKTEDSKSESQTPTANSSGPQSFEDGKKELENKALEYLKEHNIDPMTAGETGELCQHCGKKIWNPDKYGAFIPGMPDDYENSRYCLGTCAISFE